MQLFELVADVPRYPEFLPWCHAGRIRRREGPNLQIAELAIANDVIVLSDEVYSKIIYEGEHNTIAALPGMKERTILMDAHSKTYAMTGWRLGYAAMPKGIAE